MPLSSQPALIVVLAGLSKFTFSLLKVGQMEAAKVWNMCRDAQQVGDRRARQVAAPGYAPEADQAQILPAFAVGADGLPCVSGQREDNGRTAETGAQGYPRPAQGKAVSSAVMAGSGDGS